MIYFLLLVLGYIIGSIPFSYLFTRFLTNKDIRTQGSGNVGATNAYRTSGWLTGLLSLLGDMLKGIIGAWIVIHLAGDYRYAVAFVGFGIIIGHCYPVLLKFRGGKGVASAAGYIFMLMPNLIIPLVVIFLSVVFFSRYVSLGSIAGAFFLPFLIYYSHRPWEYLATFIVLSILVIFRHKENIVRLRAGTESKFSFQREGNGR